jgi:hypothetical protein
MLEILSLIKTSKYEILSLIKTSKYGVEDKFKSVIGVSVLIYYFYLDLGYIYEALA